MDVQKALIQKVVYDGAYMHETVVERRITPEFFDQPDNRRVWEWLLGYWQTYGTIPTRRTLQRDFPNYEIVEVTEPIGYLLDSLQAARMDSVLRLGMYEITDVYDKSTVYDARDRLSSLVQQLNTEVSPMRDADIQTLMAGYVDLYMEIEASGGALQGVPSGFQSIDALTSGIMGDQLYVVAGLPKSGKSTVMVTMAKAAYDGGYKVLFIGFEMSNKEQLDRLVAMYAGVNLIRLRSGRLRPEEKERLVQAAKAMEANELRFVLSTDISSATTLAGVSAKIGIYDPDVVFVDGAYMMEDQEGEPRGSAAALTNITRGFKRMAQNWTKPIVISTQMLESKRASRKAKMHAGWVGYSGSFAQDADLLLGIQRSEDAHDEAILAVLAARNVPPIEFSVRWRWDHGDFQELVAQGLPDLEDSSKAAAWNVEDL